MEWVESKEGSFFRRRRYMCNCKQSGLMIYGMGVSVIHPDKFFLHLLRIWMFMIILVIKWMNLVMFAPMPNKFVAHFLKVIVKLVNLLNSYIMIFGVPIVFHQLVGHTAFCQLLTMIV